MGNSTPWGARSKDASRSNRLPEAATEGFLSSGEGLLVRCGYAGRTPSVTLTVFVLPFRVTLTLTTSDGL